MDFLHKKISRVDDVVYFLCSSVEEPYYFVRMKGQIKEMTVTDDIVTYRLQLIEILESLDIIRECVVGKHFRLKCIRRKQHPIKDKLIRGTHLGDGQLRTSINNQLKSSYFDISIMTTFSDENTMNEKLEMVNKYNIDKLSRRVEFLSHRQI